MPGKPLQDLTLGGKTFKLTPMSDKDMQELDLYVRKKYVQSVKDTLPEDISEELQKDLIREAQLTAAGMTFMQGAGARILATVEGMTRLTWQLLHHEQPDLTEAELHKLMLDPSNIDNVNESLLEMQGRGKKSTDAIKNRREKQEQARKAARKRKRQNKKKNR